MIGRTQCNAFDRELKKATCGLKYVSDSFVSDLTYDVLNEKYTTSAVFSVFSFFAENYS